MTLHGCGRRSKRGPGVMTIESNSELRLKAAAADSKSSNLPQVARLSALRSERRRRALPFFCLPARFALMNSSS